jgi:hypothetical protein
MRFMGRLGLLQSQGLLDPALWAYLLLGLPHLMLLSLLWVEAKGAHIKGQNLLMVHC